jgi:hypothetical protein
MILHGGASISGRHSHWRAGIVVQDSKAKRQVRRELRKKKGPVRVSQPSAPFYTSLGEGVPLVDWAEALALYLGYLSPPTGSGPGRRTYGPNIFYFLVYLILCIRIVILWLV